MWEKQNSNGRIDNYKEYIRNILINRDIDCDEAWWDDEAATAMLKKLILEDTWNISDSSELGINSSEIFLFVKFNENDKNRNLLKEMEKSACNLARRPESVKKNMYIICIVNNMKSRVFLEKTFLSDEGKNMKKAIRREMKEWKGTVNFLYIQDNNYGQQDIKLSNINRFDFIQMPPIKNHINWEKEEEPEGENKGYVTSVHLYQLVEIYNKIGDKLFKRNVRYGLNEQLGVDRAIKDTLRNRPQEFWFKNNGVTILVEWPDFKLDRVEEVLLEHISEYGDLHFSVINGAQTITAAAQCFYEMEYELSENREKGENRDKEEKEEEKELERKIKESKNAKVLLRIIHIHKKQKDTNEENREVNEISVALNRQKPIKAEDIAFASPFVEKMASFLEREQEKGIRYFSLVKRGEGNAANRAIDLVDFARARKACAGQPGEARSSGTNVLLSFKNESAGEYSFKDEVIFVPEWMEAEDEEEIKVFEKYYGAVNFAVRTAEFYGKNVKKVLEKNTDAAVVLQNGKWYFTAYLVQLFNGFQKEFSDFTDCFDLMQRTKLIELMQLFAIQCESAALKSGKYTKLDSNVFKSNELYKLMLKEGDSALFAEIVNRDLDEDEKIELADRVRDKKKAPEVQNLQMQRPANTKAKFIRINGGQNERINSTAHAMVRTVQFVLENYPGHEEELLKNGWDWITSDPKRAEEGYGYLRRTMEVTGEKGQTYWVGTHSNSQVKYNQIRELCRIAKVKKHSISWLAADGETQLFIW